MKFVLNKHNEKSFYRKENFQSESFLIKSTRHFVFCFSVTDDNFSLNHYIYDLAVVTFRQNIFWQNPGIKPIELCSEDNDDFDTASESSQTDCGNFSINGSLTCSVKFICCAFGSTHVNNSVLFMPWKLQEVEVEEYAVNTLADYLPLQGWNVNRNVLVVHPF